MQVAEKIVRSSNATPAITRDQITSTVERSWDELYAQDRAEVEQWQLEAARQRFDELAPQVRVLKSQADDAGISHIGTLDDIGSLLFNHTAYKSYPMSLLEKSRFGQLTKWMQGLTSLDLSGVDAAQCSGIDDWLSVLERETPLRVFHTTGTTGKLSFIPRSFMEEQLWFEIVLKNFEGFGAEPGIKVGGDGVRIPVIFPAERGGRYTSQRFVRYLEQNLAPSPSQCYTASDEFLSADVVSLSGRVRVAQAKGDLSSMQLAEPQRLALKKYLLNLQTRPHAVAQFFASIAERLQGERVFLVWHATYLYKAAMEGLAKGQSGIFSPNSLCSTGGGNKDMVLPEDWLGTLKRFLGIQNWTVTYGMSETTGVKPLCSAGYYHIPPYDIPYLLDPETGAVLPRQGRQTGRYAELDLLAQTFWGGVVSSDKVTIEWDRECPCGRKGAHLHDNIVRYDDSVTGDDKITCSATVDYTDSALMQLLNG